MISVLATLPEAKHFRQIQNRGERYQWADRSTDNLRILATVEKPWQQEWKILIRLEQGETRAGVRYPRRLNLLCLPPEPGLQRAKIVRDRWSGNFAHSTEPTLLHFDFPVETEDGRSWLMLSIVPI
jgi:hypothetical protein